MKSNDYFMVGELFLIGPLARDSQEIFENKNGRMKKLKLPVGETITSMSCTRSTAIVSNWEHEQA